MGQAPQPVLPRFRRDTQLGYQPGHLVVTEHGLGDHLLLSGGHLAGRICAGSTQMYGHAHLRAGRSPRNSSTFPSGQQNGSSQSSDRSATAELSSAYVSAICWNVTGGGNGNGFFTITTVARCPCSG